MTTNPAIKFLTTLFAPGECILVRPIETWMEDGRKQNRVAHQHVRSAAVVLPPDRPFMEAAKDALSVQAGVAHASV